LHRADDGIIFLSAETEASDSGRITLRHIEHRQDSIWLFHFRQWRGGSAALALRGVAKTIE